MATSREFLCPGCKRTLNMTDEMHMVAIMYHGGGSFMGFGSFDLRDSATCPHCNTVMPIEDIVAGKYSPRDGPAGCLIAIVVWAALIGGIIFLVRWCST